MSRKSNFSYHLYFTSLVAPNFDPADSSFGSLVDHSLSVPRRTQLKRSYLLMSWFAYLSRDVSLSKTETAEERVSHLAILPSKRKLYTLQKAPMAHKTNSKEQFMFRFYAFKFSTRVRSSWDYVPRSVNESLAVHFLIRRSFPFFETNLLFLKYYSISSSFYDRSYFSFYEFLANRRSLTRRLS